MQVPGAQPGFQVMDQGLPGATAKPFRLHVAEGDLATARGHGDADRFVVEQGNVQVQPLVGQPGVDMFGSFVVSPGGDDFRVIAVVEGATDADRTLDDPADNAGVGGGCLADVQGCFHGADTSIH